MLIFVGNGGGVGRSCPNPFVRTKRAISSLDFKIEAHGCPPPHFWIFIVIASGNHVERNGHPIYKLLPAKIVTRELNRDTIVLLPHYSTNLYLCALRAEVRRPLNSDVVLDGFGRRVLELDALRNHAPEVRPELHLRLGY